MDLRPPSTEEVQKRLNEVLVGIGCTPCFKLVQINGQRKMFNPAFINQCHVFTEGCEVFVGRLPRDLYEDELVPPFLSIGPIVEIRTMMNFSGTNRGFAFVKYYDAETARRAIVTLNNYEIKRGHFIGVVLSVNNKRLLLKGLNVAGYYGNIEYLLTWLKKFTDGVKEVISYHKNRSAIVVYNSHRDAAMARRRLIPIKDELFGPYAVIDWADPRYDYKWHKCYH